MKTFKQFISEDLTTGQKVLDAAPKANKGTEDDDYWLGKHATEKYTDNREEVHPKDLGMKMSTGKGQHAPLPKNSYELTKLQKVPLDKIEYTQPRVNREKLRHFMHHYHPSEEDFHTPTELRKHEAPYVTKYPDGTYVSHDHHRLIASHLRGDTHAIARVATMKDSPKGFKQVKTK